MCLSLKTLKTIIRNGLPILVKLIYLFYYNFSTPNDLTQMVNFLSWIPNCDIDSPDPFDLFYCFDASIFSTMAFLQLGNSAHAVVSFSTDFPSCSQQDVPFHHIAYDCSRANSDSLCDHLRDSPWKDIFKLNACAAASKFCEWVQLGIDVYISNRRYQVKLHLSPWFSTESAAAIVHRNHCFCLYQMDKSSESKVQLRHARNCGKRALESAKLKKHNSPSLPRNLTIRTFDECQYCSQLSTGKSDLPPLFNSPELLSSASD